LIGGPRTWRRPDALQTNPGTSGRGRRTDLREILRLLGWTAAGGLLGCGGAFGLQSPTADYRDFSVQSLSLQQIGFDLGFDLGNPNSIALPVATLDWNLDLFQKPFTFGQVLFDEGPGEQRQDDINPDGGILTYLGIQNIPANSQLALNTPFTVAIADTFEGIARVALGEDVPFLIGGTLHVGSTFGSFDLPFSQGGVWPNGALIGFLDGIGTDILDGIISRYQGG
jgi:hypothetical protein